MRKPDPSSFELDAMVDCLVVAGAKDDSVDRFLLVMREAASWDLYQTTRDFNCSRTEKQGSRDVALEFDSPRDAIFTLLGMVQ